MDAKLASKETEVEEALGGLEEKIERKSHDIASTFLSYDQIVSGNIPVTVVTHFPLPW